MSLDPKSLELFVRVASVGAIGKAGAELGLSSTAATQRIQSLEAVTGIQLFHRTTRTVSLTSDGEDFLEHAKRILESVEEALSAAQKEPRALKGDLRVASSASFGRKHIAPYLSEFLDAHPDLSVQLSLTDSVVDIVGGGFDLSIRLGELVSSSLMVRKLVSSPRIVVASPSYLEKVKTPKLAEDLCEMNCLMRGGVRSWTFRGPGGATRDYNVSGNFSCDSAEAITEAAKTGLGIARKCEWEVREELESGRLVQLLEDYTVMPEWNVFAIRSPSRFVPARVSVFTNFLKHKLRSDSAFT